jgi:SAM-dependent methyltransferase
METWHRHHAFAEHLTDLSGVVRPVVGKWNWLIFKRALGRKNRFKPFSRAFGSDRGRPIDRYYIDRFIAAESAAITGRVLEFGDNRYTRAFGKGVVRSDVLCPSPIDPGITLVADLADAPQIADDSFDCIVCTQALQCVYDHGAAVRTPHRILKPSGTLLATLPFMPVLSGVDMALWGEYWRFTSQAAHRMFSEAFGPANVASHGYGNLVVVTAFLHGFAVEDLDPRDFAYTDPLIEMGATIKAVKVLH